MKRIIVMLVIVIGIALSCSPSYAEFYSSLPSDIGSNSDIMKILYPEEKKVTTYSETYLVSCMAAPGTEITLYERYDDGLFVPLTVNNEAITGTVGDSGLYLIDLVLKTNTTKRIMFFAQKDGKYQSEFRTIAVEEEKDEKTSDIEYNVLDIQKFVMNIKKSVKNIEE